MGGTGKYGENGYRGFYGVEEREQFFRDFIVMWQRGDSTEEIGKALGIPKEVVSARASFCRKHGVPLVRRISPKIDWDTLRKVAGG